METFFSVNFAKLVTLRESITVSVGNQSMLFLTLVAIVCEAQLFLIMCFSDQHMLRSLRSASASV